MSPVAPLLSLGVRHKGDPAVTTATTKTTTTATTTPATTPADSDKSLSIAASLGLAKDYEPPSISMAQDVSSAVFDKKSFALRRTRSMGGLLDDCIRPTNDMIGDAEDYPHLKNSNLILQKGTVEAAAAAKKVDAEPSPQFSASSASSYAKDSHMFSTSEEDNASIESDSDSTRDSFPYAHKHTNTDSIHESATAYNNNNSQSRTTDYDAQSNSSTQSVPGTPDLPNDDSVIQHEPERLVDYFSHEWKESDASSSWRYIVRRKDVANSARLENASWRTWTKAKYDLKTVAPERVNWLKDYDVTWLYGPLYDDHSQSLLSFPGTQEPLKEGTASAKSASCSSPSLPLKKPILKKKTVSELLSGSRPANLNLINNQSCDGTPNCSCEYHFQKRYNNMHEHDGSEVEPSNYLRHHNYRHRPHSQSTEMISNSVNRQYSYPTISEERLETPSIQSATGNSSSASLLSLSVDKSRKSVSPSSRAVHFNDRVEQCIALDDFSDSDDEQKKKPTSSHQMGGPVSLTLGDDSEDSDDSESDNDGDNAVTYKDSRKFSHGDEGMFGEAEDEDESDDSEDEDGLFLMVRTPSSTSLNQQHGKASALTKNISLLSSGSSASNSSKSIKSLDSAHKHPIIATLPAARLKYEVDEDEIVAKQTAQVNSMSHIMNRGSSSDRRPHNGLYRTYDYNSVYTSPGTSPVNSTLPSAEKVTSVLEDHSSSSLPNSSSPSPSAVDPHTTKSHVMGKVGVDTSSSATNLLGLVASGFPKSSTQSSVYTPRSYEESTSEFAENVDGAVEQQINSAHSSLSNSTVKNDLGGEDVSLSSADLEALNSMAASDDVYTRSYTSHGSRIGLGHAVHSAKDLAQSFWSGRNGSKET